MPKLHALQAAERLTKTYTFTPEGIVKTPYPMTWEFTSHDEDVRSLDDMYRVIVKHAQAGHCLLKGQLSRPLMCESRAGTTDTNTPTEWLCLDIDGLPETIELTSTTGNKVSTPLTLDLLLSELGLHDISYIVQWSASYKVMDNKLRAHIFMLLDKPYAAPLLKQWLIQKNHEVPFLRAAMELTKTGNSIRWPLDISACQNDKLIYIAPPVFKGMKDPLGKQPRIELVRRKYDVLALTNAINSAERNRQLTHQRINELREQIGLPKRKFAYKVMSGTEVMLKPDEAVITEMKTERGFVYFNLNGGDSWAYYHPENRPDFIYNFKGEPTYLTKELLPDYWAQLTQQATKITSDGTLYLAFCDRRTGQYFRGTYNENTDHLDLYQARNEKQIKDFCKQHGVPLGDFIAEWDYIFDPHDSVRVNVTNRTINRFCPSPFMRKPAKRVNQCPPTIFKIAHHALGEDPDITKHFMNWLAFIVQRRDRTKTAWVLHGIQGTGKGILTNNILRPLFAPHVTSRRMEELDEKYNHYMQDSLLIFVDEVQIKALRGERGIMAKLKNFITEEYIPIRAMYALAHEARNYTNWIFMSNMADPITIDKGDRRFNVGRYQPNRLDITDDKIKQIENELQTFHDYLMTYPVDEVAVRTVIQTEDRDNMIAVTQSSLDTIATALLEGNFEFFLEQLPTTNDYARNALQANRVDAYKDILRTLMARTRDNGQCNISRDELHVIFDYLSDRIPTSPNKFTSLLKHHRIHTTRVWVNNKTVIGLAVTWRDIAQFKDYAKQYFGTTV